MQTRDKEKLSEEREGEEKRDLEFENIVGNLLVAEYQVDRLELDWMIWLMVTDHIQKSTKYQHTYSNTITNGINYHLE